MHTVINIYTIRLYVCDCNPVIFCNMKYFNECFISYWKESSDLINSCEILLIMGAGSESFS